MTSWPACARYQALVNPTTPLPKTKTSIIDSLLHFRLSFGGLLFINNR
ncbi:Uncharacterised protein [Vibrio cholerae]|nr:Uncharacterised protein [Vibrio cholerae]